MGSGADRGNDAAGHIVVKIKDSNDVCFCTDPHRKLSRVCQRNTRSRVRAPSCPPPPLELGWRGLRIRPLSRGLNKLGRGGEGAQ